MIPILFGDEAFNRIKFSPKTAAVDAAISRQVAEIISAVRDGKDSALRSFSKQFGDDTGLPFVLTDKEIRNAVERVPNESKRVIERAAGNINNFAESIMGSVKPMKVDHNGWSVGIDFKPVASVGCYVPGGRYPLPSSALMTALTARAAGVPKIFIASPGISDEVIFAGHVAGVKKFYRMGGAQAIAALAFGTESVEAVDMVAGPGNAYVTEAKRQLIGTVGIDMLAGPSEVAIIADSGADPHLLALDMLSQLEHDPDARCWLLTDNENVARNTRDEIASQVLKLKLPDFISQSMERQVILVFRGIEDCLSASDMIAPEHLELMVSDPWAIKGKLANYGALFMGYKSTVVFGDYMAGPNHTLPTSRTSRFAEGLNPRTFLRAQSWFSARGDISQIVYDTASFANIEGLTAHIEAARARGTPEKPG